MHISTLIDDIYSRVSSSKKVSKKNLEDLLEGISNSIIKHLEEDRKPSDKKTIRMSSIGKPDRKLWMDFNGPKIEVDYNASSLIKFLYGSIIEELVLFLAKEAGHSIQEPQKQLELEGIKGHIDCKIDGEIVDVKSASDFAFRKFKTGSIESDDPFGYIAQISAYAEAEGKDCGYFLAMNKVTGELVLHELDDFSLINASQRIKDVKKIINSSDIPPLCYDIAPEGKSGNMRISKDCSYCYYKWTCYPDMRVFKYHDGLKYLVKVEKEPNVPEVTETVRV